MLDVLDVISDYSFNNPAKSKSMLQNNIITIADSMPCFKTEVNKAIIYDYDSYDNLRLSYINKMFHLGPTLPTLLSYTPQN